MILNTAFECISDDVMKQGGFREMVWMYSICGFDILVYASHSQSRELETIDGPLRFIRSYVPRACSPCEIPCQPSNGELRCKHSSHYGLTCASSARVSADSNKGFMSSNHRSGSSKSSQAVAWPRLEGMGLDMDVAPKSKLFRPPSQPRALRRGLGIADALLFSSAFLRKSSKSGP